MEGLIPAGTGRYISIKADGKLHEKVSAETEGAVMREYETSDGKTGTKWELVYQKVENVKVTNVWFEDGEYGENLLINLSDGENDIILSQATGTKFGEDLLKKLPAVDFSEKITLQPYSFENDKGKMVQGVNLYQKSDKVMNFFYDGEQNTNGFPTPDKKEDEEWSKDQWKAYFLNVRIFLVKYAKTHIVPKFAGKKEELAGEFEKKAVEKPEDDSIDPSSIPF